MELRATRAFFDTYGQRPAEKQAELPPSGIRFTCPCCGYPTLGDRGSYSICRICWWEDDGQDDDDADEVRGGPNGTFSLSEARANFGRYRVMYPPDRDTRISAPDSPEIGQIKRELLAAFDAMMGGPDADHLNHLWREVQRCEGALDREVKRSLEAYARRQNGPN